MAKDFSRPPPCRYEQFRSRRQRFSGGVVWLITPLCPSTITSRDWLSRGAKARGSVGHLLEGWMTCGSSRMAPGIRDRVPNLLALAP